MSVYLKHLESCAYAYIMCVCIQLRPPLPTDHPTVSQKLCAVALMHAPLTVCVSSDSLIDFATMQKFSNISSCAREMLHTCRLCYALA
jgi:hypothetical protein